MPRGLQDVIARLENMIQSGVCAESDDEMSGASSDYDRQDDFIDDSALHLSQALGGGTDEVSLKYTGFFVVTGELPVEEESAGCARRLNRSLGLAHTPVFAPRSAVRTAEELLRAEKERDERRRQRRKEKKDRCAVGWLVGNGRGAAQRRRRRG